LLSQLYSQLYSQLNGQLHNQLDSQLDSQLLSLYNYETHNTCLFTLNVYSDAYYSWFKFIKEEFNLPLTIEEDFEECFRLQRESGIYSAIFSAAVCVVCKYPKKVNRNNNHDLHSTQEPAVIWGQQFADSNMYFINNRNIPAEIFEKTINKEITFEEFISIENEDVKAGVITIIKENFGNDELMKFLDAEVIDTHTFHHTSGYNETQRLWRTRSKLDFLADDNNNRGNYMSWYEITCPSTGTVYMLDTRPDFTTVDQCARFHRPAQIPTELKYNFTKFNN
jgi:hypothetical protein